MNAHKCSLLNSLLTVCITELKSEMNLEKGDEIAVLVNGLGSTTLLELQIAYYELDKRLKEDGLRVYDSEVKSWCTCQEMGGFSITILRLDEN